MRESNQNRKRDTRDFEASSTSVVSSPLKKQKKKKTKNLYDDYSSSDSHLSSSSSDSVPGGFSVTFAGEEDEDQSSSISSGCFVTESNEIAIKSPSSVVDLEENLVREALEEKTERESSSATTEKVNRRKQTIPTTVEIDEFFSELENDDKQKRFIDKYNFDIFNDKPLQGRYKWDRF
ncbi:unnamed protein product [Cochlearia groenlandica]